MFTHPDLLMSQSRQHRATLIAEADRYRLLTASRRARRAHGRGEPSD